MVAPHPFSCSTKENPENCRRRWFGFIALCLVGVDGVTGAWLRLSAEQGRRRLPSSALLHQHARDLAT